MIKRITIRICLPWTIPSLNVWEGLHWAERGRTKKKLAAEIAVKYKTQCLALDVEPTLPAPDAIITYHSIRSRRITDLDNFIGGMKGLNDAMVKAGIIADDNMDDFKQGKHQQFMRREVKVNEGTYMSKGVYMTTGKTHLCEPHTVVLVERSIR